MRISDWSSDVCSSDLGCRKIADLRWRGGIVAGDDVDEATAEKIRRALNRAVAWLSESEERSRADLLRDLAPELRETGLLPEDRKCVVEAKMVRVRVEAGGRRIMK